MKKMLNTLFILSEDMYLTLENNNIVLLQNNTQSGRFPLHTIENVICFSYKGASPALMGACADNGIGLVFLSPQGRFQARSVGKSSGNVLLRKRQYAISENGNECCRYARNMILGKVFNCRWCLERTIRDHKLRVDYEKIKNISNELQTKMVEIVNCDSLDILRGVEGELAQRYFTVFNELIINQKDSFIFKHRNKRPPLDNVNALLSFVYTILAHDYANALESVGLDSYVGFLHRDRPGRCSLALDMMEEVRAVLGDRFVLTLINNKTIREEHFERQQNGAVIMNEVGKKVFFSAWQTHKREKITHPFIKEKVEWGLVPYIQSLLLARAIRGDMDSYPPFLWK